MSASLRNRKPIRTMLATTATTVTETLLMAQDVVKTLRVETKTSRLESEIEFKQYVKEVAKDMEMTEAEVLAIIGE